MYISTIPYFDVLAEFSAYARILYLGTNFVLFKVFKNQVKPVQCRQKMLTFWQQKATRIWYWRLEHVCNPADKDNKV